MNPESGGVLIISPEPWDHIFVSKHHYAIALSQLGFQVFFLNPPGNKCRLELTPVADYNGIVVVDYGFNVKGQRFLPSFISRWLDRAFINRLQRFARCNFQVIWNFENSRFFDLSFMPKDVFKIYHQVDLNQNFNLKKAASTADICFCTTDFIKEAIYPFNHKVFKIHHGVSLDAFYTLKDNFTKNEVNTSQVKAVYVGNMDMSYLDVDLLEQVVKECPEVEFEFVGPYLPNGSTFTRLSNYQNCFFAGKMASNQLGHVLQSAHLLMVVYQEAKHKDQASPHKLVEYLASGKAIVATYTDEYKDKGNLLYMSKTNKDYLSLFKWAVANVAQINTSENISFRRAFAEANTYNRHLQTIFSFIVQYKLSEG